MFFNRKLAYTYAQVNELMSQIATPISLYLVPVNEKEERLKFFDDPSYNPRFMYRKPHKNRGLFNTLERVQEVSDVDPAISAYIIDTIKDKKQATELFAAIGNDDGFPDISKSRFKVPSYTLFKRACKILRGRFNDISVVETNEKLANKMLDYDELVPIFSSVFSVLGLDGWRLEKSKAISSKGFRTVMKTRRIMVDPQVSVSAEKLRKTIIHEVITHALRGNNGFASGYDVFGKPNVREYLDDEEGLAMLNEERYGVLRAIDVKRRAALVYAVYLGQTLSFRQVFNALCAVYPKQNAYDVVLRVKRGLSDTSLPGGYTRDACYLRGFLRLKKRLLDDEISYRNLYAGKIPLSAVSLVEEGILPRPTVYPTKELIAKVFKETGLV